LLLIVERAGHADPFCYTGRNSEGEGTVRIAIICGALALAITTASAQQRLILGKFCPAGLQSRVRGRSGLRPPGHGLLCGSDHALAFLHPRVRRDSRMGSRSCKYCWSSVHFIEAHPQRMDDAFVGLAFEALLEAWPCRKTPGPPP